MQTDIDGNAAESPRLFYALWPDDETRAALLRLQARVNGRKTRYGDLHVTLAFLGRQPAAVLPVLQTILARIPRPDMTLAIDRIGYFARQRIAWAGMHEVPDALIALRQELTRMLEQHAVAFDHRPAFKPHVTLARDASMPADTPFEPIRWQADHVALVQSITRADGASYRVLASRCGLA
jgi:2'-5' RNA ligase